MGRKRIPGIYPGKDGRWHVDKVYRGHRLPRRSFCDPEAAEGWILERIGALRARAAGVVPTFDQAAAHYVEKYSAKLSIELEIHLLKTAMPFIGQLQLDQVHDGTLKPYVKARLAGGSKAKTVNLALGIVRRILNLAARSWRGEDGKPWLPGVPPLIQFLPQDDAREPVQISWRDQREHLAKLPAHLGRMVLFDLNTGARDEALCNLRWSWEVRLPDLGFSVFVVPRRWVKGRKRDRVLVCNTVAQSIIESVRGQHEEFVFVYSQIRKAGRKPKYRPVETMNNTAWQKWRARCGLQGFRVHDIRHTVGMRLREAGVREETIADVLWHVRKGMTAHYSVAQVVELRQALELITDERHAQNVPLSAIIRQSRVPGEVPGEKKTA
jgi:integrase